MYISFPFFLLYLKLMVGHFLQSCFYLGLCLMPPETFIYLYSPPQLQGLLTERPNLRSGPSWTLLRLRDVNYTLTVSTFTPSRPQCHSKQMEIDYKFPTKVPEKENHGLQSYLGQLQG